ncbi:MAG TPA: hypothetical protein VMH22_14470 [bacterium]|nr:hypothetical protein [bacterium]
MARADSLYFRRIGRLGAGTTEDVAVAGQYAYVAGDFGGYDGLHVISIADPHNPVEVGRCSTLSGSRCVAVSGMYAYYGEDTAGLRVISVSDPTHPVEVGRCSSLHWPFSVAVRGDYAYVLDTAGLGVTLISDPSHPAVVGRCSGPPGPMAAPRCVRVVGDCAYTVYDYAGGLRVVSVADPTHPVEVGHWPLGRAWGLAVNNGLAYVSSDLTFLVLSVSDPTNPVEVGRLDSVGAPTAMSLTHGYVFCSNEGGVGLQAISVADPAHPAYVGYFGGSFSMSAAADGDYVYDGDDGLTIYQFYQLGDLDIDNDSLDVVADTLRLRYPLSGVRTTGSQCAIGAFVLANTSASYNPDSIDGPSVSPVDSIRFTCSLAGPGGTIDSILVPNLPTFLAQGQTVVCTLAAYMPLNLRDGDYTGSLLISGKDTAGLQVYESCYVSVRKLGDIDVDNDSLDVVADTVRLRETCTPSRSFRPSHEVAKGGISTESSLDSRHSLAVTAGSRLESALGEFVLVNTSASSNPDTSDGPSRSPVDSFGFFGKLTGPGGTIDSLLIRNLPGSLAQGRSVTCTLAVYVPDSLSIGDYSGPIFMAGFDSIHCQISAVVYAHLHKSKREALGDLDVDPDSLNVVHDTMNLHTQPAGPVYHPYAKAEFMLVNTSSAYNPDTTDGPSRSPLRQVKVEAEVEAQNRTTKSRSAFHSSDFTLHSSSAADSVYVLNLPESLAIGQAVQCTLALVFPVGESLGSHSGWVIVSAIDTLGYQVRDSFFLKVTGPQPRQSLDSLRVAPIPFKPHTHPEQDAIHFQGLSAGARVTIYDNSGQSVWSATEHGDGHLAWDAKVASGIYVYLIVTADGKSSKVGKLSVIR